MAADKKIIFAPDKNLGGFINKKSGRNMLLWNGACMVHEIFSLEKITKLKASKEISISKTGIIEKIKDNC